MFASFSQPLPILHLIPNLYQHQAAVMKLGTPDVIPSMEFSAPWGILFINLALSVPQTFLSSVPLATCMLGGSALRSLLEVAMALPVMALLSYTILLK